MRTGSIYAYEYPGSGRVVYVGSTQDGNTLRRHREHLKTNGALGRWLHWYGAGETPVPREVERIEYESVDDLLRREAYWQEELGTMRVQGGLNKVPAWPFPDHAAIGRLGGQQALESGRLALMRASRTIECKREGGHRGGLIGGPIAARRNVESGQLEQARALIPPEHMRERGRRIGLDWGSINGQRNVENGRLARARTLITPEQRRTVARKNIESGLYTRLAYSTNHKRWHVNRNIVNPECPVCQKENI
jgi:hypothetical protein